MLAERAVSALGLVVLIAIAWANVIPVDADDVHLLRVEVERSASQFLDLSDDRIAVSEDYTIKVLSVGAGRRDACHGDR